MSLAICGCHGDAAGPRPPVPGEEDHEVLQVKDDVQFFSKTSSHWSEGWTAPPRRGLGFEPEGSASWDGPHEPWAETLLALLADQDGTMFFKQFLRSLGCSELLDFWFACSGFQKFPASDTERRLKLAKAIYRCYLSEPSRSAVSRQVAMVTRCSVMDAIRRSQLDSALFAQAHAEVQTVLEYNLFPLFLRSDVYIKHTQNDNQTPTKLASSTDHQNTVLPRQPDSPSPGSKTELFPSYNTANQTSSRRSHTCRQHIRTTQERVKTHKHLPHTPVKMRTHTFISELMRRLQELHAAEEDADVTDRTTLCRSHSTTDSSAHSPCYYDTGHDINTCEAHTHSMDTLHSGCAGLTVVYYLCGEVIPYRTCVQGNTVTLAQFKSLMTDRDSYRFFFKSASSEFDCGVVYEEIGEDETVLPTFDHKIIAKVERMKQ